MEPKPHWWRKALAIDLSIYLVGLFLFALLPPTTLNWVEITLMIMSVIALIGVVSHASTRISLPGEQWSYLVTGVLGLLAFGAYESYALYAGDVEYQFSVTYGVFLIAGAASGYAAHVIDGGKRIPPKGRRRNG